MTTKKKRKRPYQAPQTRADEGAPAQQQPPAKTTTKAPTPAAGISAASVARRERKDEARAQREAAQKTLRRQQTLRRAAILGLVVAGVAVGAYFLLNRNKEADELQTRAQAVATRQDCTQPVSFPEQTAGHVDPPTPITYTEQPPVGGDHRPVPLDPNTHVYTEQPDVTQAVHSLEHGYVIMWYRDGTLPQDVVDDLAQVADQSKVILMPYDQLPDGVDLSFSSWQHRQDCPVSNGDDPLSPAEARTLAESFIAEFRNGPDAPEPNAI
jgi:hypothetical protein